MVKRIYRWLVPVDGREHDIWSAPMGPIHLVSLIDTDLLEFWAALDPNEVEIRHTFAVVGTGHNFSEQWQHLGTAPRSPEGLVWHLLKLEQK